MSYLKIQIDRKTIKEIQLEPGEYLIGRDAGCAIALPGPNVSRRHARLICREGQILLQDLDSLNGTYLNRQPVTSGIVHPGDTIRISSFILQVCEKSSAPLMRPGLTVLLLLCIVLIAFTLLFLRNRESSIERVGAETVPSHLPEVKPPVHSDSSLAKAMSYTDLAYLPPRYKLAEANANLTGTPPSGTDDAENPPVPPPHTTTTQSIATSNLQVQAPTGRRALTKQSNDTVTLQPVRQARTVKTASPASPAPAHRDTSVVQLSAEQKKRAEQLYYQAYQIMAYRTKSAYLNALVLFKQVQGVAPDPEYEFYRKAEKKIEILKVEINKG